MGWGDDERTIYDAADSDVNITVAEDVDVGLPRATGWNDPDTDYEFAGHGAPRIYRVRHTLPADGEATVFRLPHPYDVTPSGVAVRSVSGLEDTPEWAVVETTAEAVYVTFEDAPEGADLTWDNDIKGLKEAGPPTVELEVQVPKGAPMDTTADLEPTAAATVRGAALNADERAYSQYDTDTDHELQYTIGNETVAGTTGSSRDYEAGESPVARWYEEGWWPVDGCPRVPGDFTTSDLGRLNKAVREGGGQPTNTDLYDVAVAWLGAQVNRPVEKVKALPLPKLTSELAASGDAAAANRLLVGRKKTGRDRGTSLDKRTIYHFTRFYAPDFEDHERLADAIATERDNTTTPTPEDTTMPNFDITDHVETTTVTEHTTTTTEVPTSMDASGEVMAEAETEVQVEQEVEVIDGGCQRDACTEDHLPVDSAIPVVAGLTDDGHARALEAWCPFCVRSVYGDDAVEGDEIEALMPPAAEDAPEEDPNGDVALAVVRSFVSDVATLLWRMATSEAAWATIAAFCSVMGAAAGNALLLMMGAVAFLFAGWLEHRGGPAE